MAGRCHAYFNPFSDITEGNPQLIMQGGLDDNVLPAFQVKIGEAYRAAGGDCEVKIFEGCGYLWVLEPGLDADRAHDMVSEEVGAEIFVQNRSIRT